MIGLTNGRQGSTRVGPTFFGARHLKLTDGRPLCEPKAGLHLGNFGSADGYAMWFGPVELNDHALALLADEGHMRDRDDVASMNANEQFGVELGLGLRDRPWAHPFAG